jgi:hypothetical protein
MSEQQPTPRPVVADPLPRSASEHCRPGRCLGLTCCSYECSQGRCPSIPASSEEAASENAPPCQSPKCELGLSSCVCGDPFGEEEQR